MAKAPITKAEGITPEVMQRLNQHYSSQELRGIQTKLTSTARELRKLGNGGKMSSNRQDALLGRLGDHLSLEQRQLLREAAELIDSVNTQVEHAKEKKVRVEKASKRRQEARDARAKQLIATNYPLPTTGTDDLLNLLKAALIFNRAGVYRTYHLPSELNQEYRNKLAPPVRLLGWPNLASYRANTLSSIRWDLISDLTSDIAYDDGSEVDERLKALQQKVSDALARASLTTEEQETIRLWTEALAPEVKPDDNVAKEVN
ncbi:hypothetical protein K5D56_04680 [Pseudomonas cichorii]|nr:hypothetical protein [Pseudomonas cichorii]